MRLFLLVGLLAAASAPLVSLAQMATPVPSFNTAAPQTDLAAMTLRPSEVARLGLTGFGLAAQSSLRDAEAESTLEAVDDKEAAEFLASYQAEGFRYRYVGSLLKPRVPLQRLPSGLVAAEQRLNSSVADYASAEGAHESFALNEGELDEPRGVDITGSHILGDESDLTRSTGKEANTRERYQRLELTFRIDNLIGEVSIVDFDNVEPDVAIIEKLADLLLIKIVSAHIAPGPGLSFQVLRTTPLAPWIEEGRLRDVYVRIAGRREPLFAQLVDAIRKSDSPSDAVSGQMQVGASFARDTYLFWTPVGEGDAFQLPLYVSWLDKYDSADFASAALHAIGTTDLGPGYFAVRDRTDTDVTVGDEWIMYSYSFDDGIQPQVAGYVLLARIGNIIIRVQSDAPAGVNGDGVLALGRLQAACVHVVDACAPVPTVWLNAALAPTTAKIATPSAANGTPTAPNN